MKSKTNKIILNTLALVLSAIAANAQTPERIDFAKEGSPSLVWEQKVPAGGTKAFVFYAKKGQKLTLGFIDDTNQGSMDMGKVSIEPNTAPYQSTIEVSKDYTLRVSNNGAKETSYRISISLENAPANKAKTARKETVRFAKGATSATLTRTLAASGSLDFVINAKKGQKMDFTIGYDFEDTDVEGFLTEPGSQDISLTTGPKAPNEFVVNRSGNHHLTLNNTTAKKITITLYLNIE